MKKKFFRWGAPVLLVLFGAIIYVSAQTVIDSYNDQSKIAASWNISTSTAGEIKIAAKYCDDSSWFCSASTTCANSSGDGQYIIVARSNAPSTYAWKNAATGCDRPQCGIDGGQLGDSLSPSNVRDFSDYPARDYCKSIGARLPNESELACIYTNRVVFGNNFGGAYYWSATEYSVTNARYLDFSDGFTIDNTKTTYGSVRCVRGW
jgi:hypothetical protein